MENIKFIREIMSHGKNKHGKEFGDCIYYAFDNGNRAKVYVEGGNIFGESHGVTVEIVNKTDGAVDKLYFPFENYFKPVKCSDGAPLWYQHIRHGNWYFSRQYDHVIPTTADYRNIANAICEYMKLYE